MKTPYRLIKLIKELGLSLLANFKRNIFKTKIVKEKMTCKFHFKFMTQKNRFLAINIFLTMNLEEEKVFLQKKIFVFILIRNMMIIKELK